MPRPRPVAAAALIAAALAAPAFATPAAAAEPPLRVLATIGMIADVARQVAGDCAEVTALLGPGVDPHLHRATAGDVRRLSEAELILYVDPALEARLAEALAGFSGRTPTVGLARAAFGAEELLADPAEAGAIDPHLWLDAARWARIAPVIAEAVAAQRPACAEAMAGRVAAVEARLTALDGWVREAVATIPEGRRLLVTAHDAFGYFADAYGVEASEAIAGISTEAEASIADIREVAAFVTARGVPAVFVESTVNPRTVEALVAEVRAQGRELRIGGELFSDAMGAEGTAEGTYVGMIRHNAVTIVEALGGTVPPLPAALADWAAEWGVSG